MTAVWAYDAPNEEVVDKVTNLAAKLGVSQSGLVIDLSGSSRYTSEEFFYWRGVLFARLDKKRPPFERGVRVRLKSDLGFTRLPSLGRQSGEVVVNQICETSRIYYNGNGKWSLSFKKDESGSRFEAKYFELADTVADTI